MAKMDIDDVVDLSLGSTRESLAITQATVRDLRVLAQNSGLTITPAPPPLNNIDRNDDTKPPRRVLRPRTEPKSYVEAPDIVLLPAKFNIKQQNGSIEYETDDMDVSIPFNIKELTPAEIKEREKGLRKLREDLRNEETKLVLLKKLKQSQHIMKENLIVTATNLSPTTIALTNPLVTMPMALTKGSLSVMPTTALPIPAHSKNRSVNVLGTNRTQPSIGRNNNNLPPPRSPLPGGATLTPGGPPIRNNSGILRTGSSLTITPSVTITPTSAPPVGAKPRNVPGNTINNSVSITPALPQSTTNDHLIKNERLTPREEIQTPAQRQAAAKLALRKQLEKTLLQIPPPKPPPPEMQFIPNPSNTDFVYLLGLEHVVDYLTTKDKKSLAVLSPFRCAQCKTDFTPVWKWEKHGKEAKVICEQCVTTNVKKALKAEHTNRLKTAFVKALQQEQEIEQRLATQSSPSPIDSHPSTPIPSVSTPVKSQTPTPTPRPTPPPPAQPTPTPPPPAPRTPRHDPVPTPSSNSLSSPAFEKFPSSAQLSSLNNVVNLANLGNIANSTSAATAAAMQAFQQQIFRGLQQGLASGNPQHMMQFTPLLYSYHLAMAQAAQAVAGKNPPSLADIQRAAEMQRQYLLEMIPPQVPGPSNNNRQNNWKT